MYRQTEELYLPHRKAEQMNGTISRQALRRLPFYLDYLKKKQADGVRNISATTVANELKLNEVQVLLFPEVCHCNLHIFLRTNVFLYHV